MPSAEPTVSENVELRPEEGRATNLPPGKEWAVRSGYVFAFTRDGSLEVRNPSGAVVWESETRGKGADRLTLDKGHLAIFAPGNTSPLWSSKTADQPGAFVSFQEDGNMVIYTPDQQPLWASDTNGK